MAHTKEKNPAAAQCYLVTGGAGFIGSHVADALLAEGYNVRILDDLSSGHKRNIPDGAEFLQGSITDADAVHEASENVDGIFHLAAIASVPRCTEQLAAAHEVNLTGTLRLFEVARNGSIPIVYTSSAAMYGDNPNLPLSESEPAKPLSAYGLDKYGCEQHAKLLDVQGLRSVGIRPFNVYGPKQDPSSSYSGVISLFCRKLQEAETISIYGDGEQTRDFIQARDVAKHFLGSMYYLQRGGASTVLNACTGEAISIRELAKMLMEISATEVEVLHVDARAGDIRHSAGNPTLANETLNLTQRVPLRDGLAELWRYLQRHKR